MNNWLKKLKNKNKKSFSSNQTSKIVEKNMLASSNKNLTMMKNMSEKYEKILQG